MFVCQTLDGDVATRTVVAQMYSAQHSSRFQSGELIRMEYTIFIVRLNDFFITESHNETEFDIPQF